MLSEGKLYGSVFEVGDFPPQKDTNLIPLHVERRADNGMSGTIRSWDGSISIDLTCDPSSVSLATIREAGWYDKRDGTIKLYDGFIGEMLITYKAPDHTPITDSTRLDSMMENDPTERDRPPGYRMPNYKGKSKYNRKKKERVKNKHKR